MAAKEQQTCADVRAPMASPYEQTSDLRPQLVPCWVPAFQMPVPYPTYIHMLKSVMYWSKRLHTHGLGESHQTDVSS